MKRIINNIVCVIALGFSIVSCDSVMDINTDPNYPGDTSMELLLPSAELSFSGILGGDMQLVGSLWSQHYTQNSSANQYNTTVSYDISSTSYARFWSIPYAASLPDLRIIGKKAVEAQADNYYMVSEIMTCFIYHVLASWYENIPYSESLMGKEGISNPKYDNGRDINEMLIKRLDDALAKAASAKSSTTLMGKADLVFGGDMDKWVEFGNSLKLKLMMLDFDKYKSNITSLISGGKLLSSDCNVDVFSDKENNSNPLYENDRRKLNTSNNLAASSTLLKYLQGNGDPRIPFLYETNNEGAYGSLDQGDRPAASVMPSAKLSLAIVKPEDPVYFITYAEICFLKAEVYARTGNATMAETEYNNGVEAAFGRYKLDAKPFIVSGGKYAFDKTNSESMLKSILTQKWVASVRCNAWSTYFDINRTGYPALGTKFPSEDGYVLGTLSPVVGSAIKDDQYPKRMIYTKNSSDNNTNAPEPIGLTVKQWWQK